MRTSVSLIISLCCFLALASPTSPSCFTIQKVSEGSAKITSYRCSCTSIEIPERIGGLKIVAIGTSAFEGQKLVSVLIPDGVKVIEANAFHQSYLERVSLPDSIEVIESFAFWYGKLTEVRLPKNLKELGYGAFSRNDIKNINLPNSVTKIGPAVFYQNRLETAVLSSGLKDIPQMAFFGNNLKTVVIPDQVKSIGEVAFSSNALVEVTLPEGLEVIGRAAFRNNLLEEISLPLNLRLIDEYAFFQNQLFKVELPEKVEVVEGSAFKENPLIHVKAPGKAFLKDAFDQNVQVERLGPDNSGLWAKYNIVRKENSLIIEFIALHEVFLSNDKKDYILYETTTNIKTGEVTETSSITDPRIVSLDKAREQRDSCERNGGEIELQLVNSKEVQTCRREQPWLVRVYAEVPFGFYLRHQTIDDDSFSFSEKKQLLDFGKH